MPESAGPITLRTLVVDDEPGMRLGIARALQGYVAVLEEIDTSVTFEVDLAETGEEAVQKVEARPPDILLLDYKLPGMSGLDVLARLADRNLDTLTLMITAYASLETAVSATKRGAYDFIAKPFTPAELKAALTKAATHLMLQRKARQLFEEKRQVRFQFISVLAHELKSPLAAIEGYLHIMKDHTLGDELGAYDALLVRTLDRASGMRKLIGDLLDLTRIESGRKKRELGTVDVRAVARTAIESVAPDSQRAGITIELHADAPVEMTADAGEIEIILNNLVSNAVKYNRPGGRVDVRIEAAEGRVTIAVADTGIGMAPEDAARLFREFVRIKTERTRKILGSGLGLSIVKKLAQLYDGDVTVTSEPDVGSTFTVVLASREGAAG